MKRSARPSAREISSGPLSITLTERGTAWEVALAGELDLANVEVLRRLLAEGHEDGAELTVVDLRALEFIDSSGIAALLEAHRRLDGGAGALRLVLEPGSAVERTLRITGLEEQIPFDSEPQRPSPNAG